jgi:hypothetical protein
VQTVTPMERALLWVTFSIVWALVLVVATNLTR